MGQGLYNLIGYGVLNPDRLDEEDDAQERAYGELDDLGLDYGYETDPDYAVIPLAVEDEVLQEWWKLPALPDTIYRCAPRRAREIEETAYAVPDAVKARWREAQAIYKSCGLTLGEAKLIVLNDWD